MAGLTVRRRGSTPEIWTKKVVADTTLYIPVHVQGAIFQVGNGHSGQGDGIVVRKDLKLR